MYDYMKALHCSFCGRPPKDERFDKVYSILTKRLDNELYPLLIELVDIDSIYCEDVSFQSFLAGFRLAGGISTELMEGRFNFEEAEYDISKKLWKS